MKMLGWKALLVVAALLLPGAANAQRSGDAAKAAAPSKEDIAKGRAAVPGLIQAAGARCAVGDAAFRGTGTSAKKKVDIYETACTDGPGYLLIKTEGVDKPAAYPCLAVADQGTKCILPANADQKPGLPSWPRRPDAPAPSATPVTSALQRPAAKPSTNSPARARAASAWACRPSPPRLPRSTTA